jgi:hypothetical protein
MDYGGHNESPLKLLRREPSRGRRQWRGQMSSLERTWQVTKACWGFFFHLKKQRIETSQSHPEVVTCCYITSHWQFPHTEHTQITRKDTKNKNWNYSLKLLTDFTCNMNVCHHRCSYSLSGLPRLTTGSDQNGIRNGQDVTQVCTSC